MLRREQDGELAATEAGRNYRQMVARYRERLAEIIERWSPDDYAEVRAMLTTFSRDLLSDLPLAPK